MKFGVIIFPGSNCNHDAHHAIEQVAHQPVTFLWHESHDLQNCDAVIVPQECDRLVRDLLDGVMRIVVAVGAGKDDDTEFHGA